MKTTKQKTDWSAIEAMVKAMQRSLEVENQIKKREYDPMAESLGKVFMSRQQNFHAHE